MTAENVTRQALDLEADPVLSAIFSTQKSLCLPNSSELAEQGLHSQAGRPGSWLGVPIVAGEHIIGLVEFEQAQLNFYTPEHIRWAEALVKQAAVAIQNAWLFEQVRAGRERLQSLSRRLVEVQETERRFIARELHDQAGQSLTSLLLGLGSLEKEADNPQNIHAHIVKLKKQTDGILEGLHRLAVNLRPAGLDHLGLVATLEQLVRSFAGQSQIRMKFKSVGVSDDERLPAEIETAFYRIVQEALTNIMRHAQATRADVLVERRDDVMLLIVEDDGVGFDAQNAIAGDHLGLLGIQERADTLGGKLTIESSPGQGTTLVVEVPYANPHSAGG